jgi:predicted metalloprotease
MRWRSKSGDDAGVEVRQGRGGGGGLPIPGGFKTGAGGLGILGVIVALLVVLLNGGGASGFDIGPSLDPYQAPADASQGIENAPQADQELLKFVAFLQRDIQDTWQAAFESAGRPYERSRVVVFRDAVATACGDATSAVGPFYCPADRLVYFDLSFMRELGTRFKAPGDFAQAYVVAHEFGHHIQSLLGISDQVAQAQQADPDRANELSVRQELQADCFAGVWAHSAYERTLLEEGDLEEGLAAAAAVGDDRLQQEATGRINPDTFTHGTSEQRTNWFLKGFQGGDVASCDTFSGGV